VLVDLADFQVSRPVSGVPSFELETRDAKPETAKKSRRRLV
jgi:hypothetical protein